MSSRTKLFQCAGFPISALMKLHIFPCCSLFVILVVLGLLTSIERRALADPIAGDDYATVSTASPIIIDVVANDYEYYGGQDATLDPATIQITTAPAYGEASVDAEAGTVIYSPGSEFSGYDIFEYTVSNTLGQASNTARVWIDGYYDDGYYDDGYYDDLYIDYVYSYYDSQSQLWTITGTVYGGTPGWIDVVLSGDVVDVVSVTTDGDFTATFSGDANADYLVTLQAVDSDSGLSSDTYLEMLYGTSESTLADPPIASEDFVVAAFSSTTAIDVLANDYDNAAVIDLTTVQIISAPSNGHAAVDSYTGIVNYSPASGFDGEDSFEYCVSDTSGQVSNTTTVWISVEQNQPPSISYSTSWYDHIECLWTIEGTVEDETPGMIEIYFGGDMNDSVLVASDGRFIKTFPSSVDENYYITLQAVDSMSSQSSDIVEDWLHSSY